MDAVPLAEERRYDFPEFRGYLGNVGLQHGGIHFAYFLTIAVVQADGREVRTILKHVIKRIRSHWPGAPGQAYGREGRGSFRRHKSRKRRRGP